MNDDKYVIEKREQGPDGESRYYEFRSQNTGLSWQTKLKIALILAAGIAAGVLLFLFFLTAFVYLFIPVMLALLIWQAFARRR